MVSLRKLSKSDKCVPFEKLDNFKVGDGAFTIRERSHGQRILNILLPMSMAGTFAFATDVDRVVNALRFIQVVGNGMHARLAPTAQAFAGEVIEYR